MTVVKLTNLKADLPSTPPNTARAGNAAARHAHEITGAAADHWDFDNSLNPAIVLIEDSVGAATPINLSVKVVPSGVPISWDAPRDIRPAPKGDHVDIAKRSGKPKLTANAVDNTKATLLADAVDTFHIAPFVDCNGSHAFEPTIDLEPYLAMNLVLVRVQGKINSSVAQPANARAMSLAGGVPSAAGGCQVQTDAAALGIAASAAVHSKATVLLIGGGRDGLLGLDEVFTGWCQHIAATGTSASAPQGLDIFAQYQMPAPPPPPPATHRQFFMFTRTGPRARRSCRRPPRRQWSTPAR